MCVSTKPGDGDISIENIREKLGAGCGSVKNKFLYILYVSEGMGLTTRSAPRRIGSPWEWPGKVSPGPRARDRGRGPWSRSHGLEVLPLGRLVLSSSLGRSSVKSPGLPYPRGAVLISGIAVRCPLPADSWLRGPGRLAH